MTPRVIYCFRVTAILLIVVLLVILICKEWRSQVIGERLGNRKSTAYVDQWNYNWDLKSEQKKTGKKASVTRNVFLVRHGQFDKETGRLTDLGRQQANLTARRLKDIKHPFSNIYYSSMPRAEETAKIIHQTLNWAKAEADDGLREGGPVEPIPRLTHFKMSERSYHIDGPRMESTFRKYFYRHENSMKFQTYDLLVAHGNIVRFLLLRALQLPPAAWMRIALTHCSITWIMCHPDGTVSAFLVGDSGHLPKHLVTF